MASASYYVVYLEEAKQHAVVLESWINEYDDQKMKNYGLNPTQRYLVFWCNNLAEAADFGVTKQTVFPPVNHRGTYYAKLKRVFGELVKLKSRCIGTLF